MKPSQQLRTLGGRVMGFCKGWNKQRPLGWVVNWLFILQLLYMHAISNVVVIIVVVVVLCFRETESCCVVQVGLEFAV